MYFFFSCSESIAQKENTFKTYLNTEKIITEWSKNLFTPESLLKSIEEKILYLNKDYFWFFKYTQNNINEVISDKYKYYKEFFNCIKNNKNFKIQIVYINILPKKFKRYIIKKFKEIWKNKIVEIEISICNIINTIDKVNKYKTLVNLIFKAFNKAIEAGTI